MQTTKKRIPKKEPITIRESLAHLEGNLYTRQTLVSLFRRLLEVVVEESLDSVVLLKVDDTSSLKSIIDRISYSNSNVFIYTEEEYTDSEQAGKPHPHVINDTFIDHEEFLVVIGEKFSAVIFWTKFASDQDGLYHGSWSFNGNDADLAAKHLQKISKSEKLDVALDIHRPDRRQDKRYTNILVKLINDLESRQRDLICANTELKELHAKAVDNERLIAIGQVASIVAHELRNPLGLIDLHSKLVGTHANTIELTTDNQDSIENITNCVDVIRGAVANLDRILSDILEYSKPLQLELVEQDLTTLLNDVYRLIKLAFDEKNVSFKIHYASSLEQNLKCTFDYTRLHQAMLNLLKNALEVSESGQSVEVNVHSRASDGIVYIKIKDQGPGVTEEQKEQLFTPYFTTKMHGSGIGLAQSKKIMEAHGGDLELLATSKNGSVFALELPIS